MNIIFLDIDGVLNSMAYFKANKNKGRATVSDYHLQMLAKIYHTCDANIVLSSSWRQLDDEFDMHVNYMYQYLIDELARYDMKIMSKTPVIEMNRPLEIITWLNNRVDKDNIRFVSLDDDFSKEDYDKYNIGDCLVKTTFYCDDISEGGLQQEHVNKAIKILRGESYEQY